MLHYVKRQTIVLCISISQMGLCGVGRWLSFQYMWDQVKGYQKSEQRLRNVRCLCISTFEKG